MNDSPTTPENKAVERVDSADIDFRAFRGTLISDRRNEAWRATCGEKRIVANLKITRSDHEISGTYARVKITKFDHDAGSRSDSPSISMNIDDMELLAHDMLDYVAEIRKVFPEDRTD